MEEDRRNEGRIQEKKGGEEYKETEIREREKRRIVEESRVEERRGREGEIK